jgi:hypothetical protein
MKWWRVERSAQETISVIQFEKILNNQQGYTINLYKLY